MEQAGAEKGCQGHAAFSSPLLPTPTCHISHLSTHNSAGSRPSLCEARGPAHRETLLVRENARAKPSVSPHPMHCLPHRFG